MKIIYQGFDGFDVSFQGIFPEYILYQLEQGKIKAQDKENRKPVLIYLGENEIPVQIAPAGTLGYHFVFDTGIDREKWFVANNNKSDKWNIRVSVKSLSLALYGYEGAKNNILQFLQDMEARGILEDFKLQERISRFDYCFDFETDNFVINPKSICAHSNSTRQFIGAQELISKNKDIDYVRIGKMPFRQIVFYNKLKEIGVHNKSFWFDIWEIEKDKFKKQIWRIEIRAGKEELNTWNLKTFSEFEEKAGDVLLHISNSIRYVKPNYNDKNKSRWKNKEFWDDLLNALQKDLFKFSNSTKRGKIFEGLKREKILDYKKLFLNLISPYLAITGKGFDDLPDGLSEIEKFIADEFAKFPDLFEEKIKEAKDRFSNLD